MVDFVHCHNHSEYSLLDGANKIDNLVKVAKEDGQKALALTDHGNMFGALEFYNSCKKHGIKPIVGCEVYIAKSSHLQKHSRTNGYNHLTLLAKNNIGLTNLMYLSSISYIEGLSSRPRISQELLYKYHEGIICLSGCLSSKVNELILDNKLEVAEKVVTELRDIFGKENFWLEVQRNGLQIQDKATEGIVELNRRTSIPLIATNDVHYLRHEDCDFQDTMLCQPEGTKVLKYKSGGKGGVKTVHEYVNIETLQVGDKIVSWEQNSKSGIVRQLGNEVTKIASRPYSDNLIVVHAGNKTSKYTKEHICIVKIGNMPNVFAIYLMSKNNKFRIGITRMRRINGRGVNFGPIKRAKEQNADEIWVLKTCNSLQEALLEEALLGYKYNIPTILYTNSNSRGSKIIVPVEEFWKNIPSNILEGTRCLTDFGRDISYPLYTKNEFSKPYWISRPREIRACNLIDGMLVCDVDEAISQNKNCYNTNPGTGHWKPLTISKEKYTGKVYSLEVDYTKAYIADGLLTHNCINTGSRKAESDRFRFDADTMYFKLANEMTHMFRDLPKSIYETNVVSEMVNCSIDQSKHYFPISGLTNPTQELTVRTKQELFNRNLSNEYSNRLQYELQVICSLGFAEYFLVVEDLVKYARNNGIPVGPGRGSAAGCLVSYLLGITSLDPIKHGLLFERFLNSERKSLPDVDIDFCQQSRKHIIDYLKDKYGDDKVSSIITFNRFGPKKAIRQVARVYDIPLQESDLIAKKMVADTISENLLKDKTLIEDQKKNPQLFATAEKLEGYVEYAGVHASGIIISSEPIHTLVPLARLAKSSGGESTVVTQWDLEACEKIGLVKFDILGLETLTIIKLIEDLVKKRHGKTLYLSSNTQEDLLLDNPKVFELLQNSDTEGVFQCYSDGMKRLLRDMKPDCFNDIVAAIALFRPGPLESGISDSYIARKHGKEKVSYYHDDLKKVMGTTYGTMVYQEQIMQLAAILAGFSLNEADELRKAVGKKLPELLASIEERFIRGCIALQKISKEQAVEIWQQIVKFGRYGFNKTVAAGTQVYTRDGNKAIELVNHTDQVITLTDDGPVWTDVVALHDHGTVPLFEVQFNDNSVVTCTLDHKFLTYLGQLPLHEIISLSLSVWGDESYEESYLITQERLQDISRRTQEEATRNRIKEPGWGQQSTSTSQEERSSQMAAAESGCLSQSSLKLNCTTDSKRDSIISKQNREVQTEGQCNSKENIYSSRNTTTASIDSQEMERRESREAPREHIQGQQCSKEIQSRSSNRTSLSNSGFPKKCKTFYAGFSETDRFCELNSQLAYRDRWSLSLPSNPWSRLFTYSADQRQNVRDFGTKEWMELAETFNRLIQQQNWVSEVRFNDPREAYGGLSEACCPILRKVVRITFKGVSQGYDLEVRHPRHNYLLANGICTSNSHSVCYGWLTYYTAYLKVNYPVEFFCANLTQETGNLEKVKAFIYDAKAHGISILPPCVKEGANDFKAINDNTIRIGFSAIKGMGSYSPSIDSSPNTDLLTYCRSNTTISKSHILGLAKSGALDSFGYTRSSICNSIDYLLKAIKKKPTSGALFGEEETLDIPNIPDTIESKLLMEREALDFYISGHPLNLHQAKVKSLGLLSPSLFESTEDIPNAVLVGIITDIEIKGIKSGGNKGKKYARVVLEDERAHIICIFFAHAYGKYTNLLAEAKDSAIPVVLTGRIDHAADQPQMAVKHIKKLEDYTVKAQKIILEGNKVNDKNLDSLVNIITQNPGYSTLEIKVGDIIVEVDQKVSDHDDVIKKLNSL